MGSYAMLELTINMNNCGNNLEEVLIHQLLFLCKVRLTVILADLFACLESQNLVILPISGPHYV